MSFACPKCGEYYELDDDMGNKKVSCDTCGTHFLVPTHGKFASINEVIRGNDEIEADSSEESEHVDDEIDERFFKLDRYAAHKRFFLLAVVSVLTILIALSLIAFGKLLTDYTRFEVNKEEVTRAFEEKKAVLAKSLAEHEQNYRSLEVNIEKLIKLRDQNLSDMTNQISRLRDSVRRLDEEKSEREVFIKGQQKAVDERMALEREVGKLKNDFQRLQSNIVNQTSSLAAIQTEVDGLNKQKADILESNKDQQDQYEKRVKDLTSQLFDLDKEIEKARQEKKSVSGEIAVLKTEQAAERGKLQTVEAELSAATNQLAEVQEKLARKVDDFVAYEKQRQELQAITNQISEAKNELVTAQFKRKDLESLITQLEENILKLKTSVRETQSKLDALSVDVSERTTAYISVTNKLAQANGELGESTKENERLRIEAEKLKGVSKEQSSKITSLSEEISTLRDTSQVLEQTIKANELKVEDLNAKLSKLNATYVNITNNIVREYDSLNKVNKEKETLKTEIETLDADYKIKARRRLTVESEIASFETKLRLLKDSIAVREKELEALMKKFSGTGNGALQEKGE